MQTFSDFGKSHLNTASSLLLNIIAGRCTCHDSHPTPADLNIMTK